MSTYYYIVSSPDIISEIARYLNTYDALKLYIAVSLPIPPKLGLYIWHKYLPSCSFCNLTYSSRNKIERCSLCNEWIGPCCIRYFDHRSKLKLIYTDKQRCIVCNESNPIDGHRCYSCLVMLYSKKELIKCPDCYSKLKKYDKK